MGASPASALEKAVEFLSIGGLPGSILVGSVLLGCPVLWLLLVGQVVNEVVVVEEEW